MAAELGRVNLGNMRGTLILRLDDGSEVEVGKLDMPVQAMVSVTMPARPAEQAEQDRDADRRDADEPPAPAPLDRERIDALPVGTVIADKDGDLFDRRDDAWWRTTLYGKPESGKGVMYPVFPTQRFAPYTLVSMPEPERPLQVGDRVRVRADVPDDHQPCRGVIGELSPRMPGQFAAGGHWGPIGDFEPAPVD